MPTVQLVFFPELQYAAALQGGQGMSGVGAAAAGGIGAFAGSGAFSGMQFGNVGAGMGNIFAGGCQKVESMRIPKIQPKWTCGLETVGRWTCSGHTLPNLLHKFLACAFVLHTDASQCILYLC